MSIRFLCFALFWPVSAGIVCCASDDPFDVKFGQVGIVWDGDQPVQTLIDETDVVPRDAGGETALGFVVYPETDDLYEVYSVHFLPELPAKLPSTFTMTEDGGIQTDTDKVRGPRVFSFGFDDGDPLGTYRIEVYVNDALVGSQSIEVVEPGS